MLFQGVSWLVKNSWGVSEQTVSLELQAYDNRGLENASFQPWESSPGGVLLLIGARNKVTENIFKMCPPSTLNYGTLLTSVCRAVPYRAQCDFKEYGIPHDPAARSVWRWMDNERGRAVKNIVC